MTTFFTFESDFVDSLRCIPMVARMKLDTCGVKLKLSHWMKLSSAERQVLVSMACETVEEAKIYRDFLQSLLTEKTGAPAGEFAIDPRPEWLDDTRIPEAVLEKIKEFETTLTLDRWSELTPLQRFALIKLSRPGHENANFYPALQEFRIVS